MTAYAGLLGVWDMLGEEDIDRKGEPVHAPVQRSGRVIYAAGGLVSVISTPVVRPRIPGVAVRPVIVGASDEDLKSAVLGCAAYSGRFRVEGDTVVHMVEVALNPNLIGYELSRRFVIEGDSMTFLATPIADGVALRIRWRRLH